MKLWVFYAIVSTVFAGFTSVVAKMGLVGISGELGLAVRNVFVFVFVMTICLLTVRGKEWSALTPVNLRWLAISGMTTALSWIFYYKALKEGEVSTVALIDKGSILVAVTLAAFLFKEQITWNKIVGGCMIIGGVLVIARK